MDETRKIQFETSSPPVCFEEVSNESCPSCRCSRIFLIRRKAFFEGKKIDVVYVGCPACGWKSEGVGKETHDIVLAS